jgi:hypothetical protein
MESPQFPRNKNFDTAKRTPKLETSMVRIPPKNITAKRNQFPNVPRLTIYNDNASINDFYEGNNFERDFSESNSVVSNPNIMRINNLLQKLNKKKYDETYSEQITKTIQLLNEYKKKLGNLSPEELETLTNIENNLSTIEKLKKMESTGGKSRKHRNRKSRKTRRRKNRRYRK